MFFCAVTLIFISLLMLQECCIAMPLSQILFFEEQAGGIGKRYTDVIVFNFYFFSVLAHMSLDFESLFIFLFKNILKNSGSVATF